MGRPRVRAPSLREYEDIIRRLRSRSTRRPVIENVLPLFIAITGARISEALLVSTYDLDTENHHVMIPTLKSGRGRKRMVPLPSWSVYILERYIVHNAVADRLFPVGRTMAWMIVKKATGWNPHALRHAFGMYLLYNGFDVEHVRRILGHSSWDMVRYYVEMVGIDKAKVSPLEYL